MEVESVLRVAFVGSEGGYCQGSVQFCLFRVVDRGPNASAFSFSFEGSLRSYLVGAAAWKDSLGEDLLWEVRRVVMILPGELVFLYRDFNSPLGFERVVGFSLRFVWVGFRRRRIQFLVLLPRKILWGPISSFPSPPVSIS